MSADSAREIAALRAEVARLNARVAALEVELEACRRQSEERWQAIGRLAPAAKRLRIERDELRRKLSALSGARDSD